MPVQLSNHGNTVIGIAVSSQSSQGAMTPQDKYAYTLLFPADPPEVPALLQADPTGAVTWASTALGRNPDGPLTLQGKGILLDSTGGVLQLQTNKGSQQTADSVTVQATGSCTTTAIDMSTYLPSTSGCILLEAQSGLLGGTGQMVLLESATPNNPRARLLLESGTQTAELSTVANDYSTGSTVSLSSGLTLNCIDQPVQISSGASVELSGAKGTFINSSANGIVLTASNTAADVTLTAGQGASGNMLLQAYNGSINLSSGQDLQLNGGTNGSIGGIVMTSHGSGISVTPDSAYPMNVSGNLVVSGTVTSQGQQLQAPPPTPHGIYAVVQNTVFPASTTNVVPLTETTHITHLTLNNNTLTVNRAGIYSISVDHWRVSDYTNFATPQWNTTEYNAGYQQTVTSSSLYGAWSVDRALNVGDQLTFNLVNNNTSKGVTVYAGGPGTNFHIAYIGA